MNPVHLSLLVSLSSSLIFIPLSFLIEYLEQTGHSFLHSILLIVSYIFMIPAYPFIIVYSVVSTLIQKHYRKKRIEAMEILRELDNEYNQTGLTDSLCSRYHAIDFYPPQPVRKPVPVQNSKSSQTVCYHSEEERLQALMEITMSEISDE